MATDFEKSTFKANQGVGGAALRKMQELAQSLYDSTPGLQEGNKSKIIIIMQKYHASNQKYWRM